jgi:hypothetical protein
MNTLMVNDLTVPDGAHCGCFALQCCVGPDTAAFPVGRRPPLPPLPRLAISLPRHDLQAKHPYKSGAYAISVVRAGGWHASR